MGSTARPDGAGSTALAPLQSNLLPTGSRAVSFPITNEDIDADEVDKLCDSLREIAENIKVVFNNRLLEGSITSSDFQDLKQSLEQTELDLEATLRIVNR